MSADGGWSDCCVLNDVLLVLAFKEGGVGWVVWNGQQVFEQRHPGVSRTLIGCLVQRFSNAFDNGRRS